MCIQYRSDAFVETNSRRAVRRFSFALFEISSGLYIEMKFNNKLNPYVMFRMEFHVWKKA